MEISTLGKMPKFCFKLTFGKTPYLGQCLTDFEFFLKLNLAPDELLRWNY